MTFDAVLAIYRRMSAEAEAGYNLAELAPRYAPTPAGRLAQLALEALDGDDEEMVRICLRRLIELGDKT